MVLARLLLGLPGAVDPVNAPDGLGAPVTRGTVASLVERLGYLPADVLVLVVEPEHVTVVHLVPTGGQWTVCARCRAEAAAGQLEVGGICADCLEAGCAPGTRRVVTVHPVEPSWP